MPQKETFQIIGQEKLKRSEHVWFRSGNRWKCVLCGAVTTKTPPPFGKENEWMPETYEKLTEAERAKFPYQP